MCDFLCDSLFSKIPAILDMIASEAGVRPVFFTGIV